MCIEINLAKCKETYWLGGEVSTDAFSQWWEGGNQRLKMGVGRRAPALSVAAEMMVPSVVHAFCWLLCLLSIKLACILSVCLFKTVEFQYHVYLQVKESQAKENGRVGVHATCWVSNVWFPRKASSSRKTWHTMCDARSQHIFFFFKL